VDGTLDVPGTLDFGGNTIEIDGTGTIAADDMIGGGTVTCEGTSTCPLFDPPPTTCTGGGICTEDAVTPVELIYFRTAVIGSSVELTWATASELNNDFFTIERSSNGVNYQVLNEVTGAGNSDEVLNYKYTDDLPLPGLSYYRLKQTDYDGQFEYFNAKSVTLTGLFEDKIQTNPNPVINIVHLQGFSGNPKKVRLLNIHGKDVTGRVSIITNSNDLSIDLCLLEPGIYFLKTLEGSKKIIKQ
jgi:hypothetical protein